MDRFGDAAWINGGSPTEGYLKFGADGPFKEFYNRIAGAAWADWASCRSPLHRRRTDLRGRHADRCHRRRHPLRDDVDRRPPPENNPIIDDHILGAISLVALALVNAGDTWGFGKFWAANKFVKDNPVLR